MSEIFTSELVVGERSAANDQELANPALQWFGQPVERIALDVSLRQIDGVLRYVMVGRFRALSTDKPRRLEAAADWLGLRRGLPMPVIGGYR